PELVGLLLGPRLERDAAGEDPPPPLQAGCLAPVYSPPRGCAPLIGAPPAGKGGGLEHPRDEVDRDQERKEELDVLAHGGVRLLDLVERRLPGEEVAVGLDRGNPCRELRRLRRLPERDLAPVGRDGRLELRAPALQRRRGGGRSGGVAPEVGAAAELVGL